MKKMDSVIPSAVLDDREEGEIVEDDFEFEEISDDSILEPVSGKSVSPKDHLPAISLSSVTEVDEPKVEEKIRHRRSRKKSSKSYKKRSRRRSTLSDSDSDDYVDLNRTLQNQLKAAIRVDNIEERHKNSLRTRLRAMTKLDDSDNSMGKSDGVDTNDKIDIKDSTDEGDTELAELRLEALRTAVMNKFKHRKKRKLKVDDGVFSDISMKTDTSETNKENNNNANENINARLEENSTKKASSERPEGQAENKIGNTENVIENTPPEDDEDVLRALLLASMSKKITNETESKDAKVVPSPKTNIKPTTNTNSNASNATVKTVTHFKNRVIHNTVKTKQLSITVPKVKPLIINVNGDSESDDDLFKSQDTPKINIALKPVDMEIENTVEKFLKEQRAKVEAQLQSVPKIKTSVNLKTNTSVILEKSSVKLLPKVKQLEYHKLLQKIKNAERRPPKKKQVLIRNNGIKPGNNERKIVRTKAVAAKQVNTNAASLQISQVLDIRTEARLLHRILKEMQAVRDGRLQIQEKYKVLMPIVKKINEVSLERKKYDDEVKRLINELEVAKKRLASCQEDFSTRVKNLIIEKEKIDRSTSKVMPQQQPKTPFTSTPVKETPPPLESLDASSVPSITPNHTAKSLEDRVVISPVNTRVEEEVVDGPINPGDPNDIHRVLSREKSRMPEYISPLDKVKRVAFEDPFAIICPYDVDGNCRDPECIYRHFSR